MEEFGALLFIVTAIILTIRTNGVNDRIDTLFDLARKNKEDIEAIADFIDLIKEKEEELRGDDTYREIRLNEMLDRFEKIKFFESRVNEKTDFIENELKSMIEYIDKRSKEREAMKTNIDWRINNEC